MCAARADGLSNVAIAESIQLSRQSLSMWRQRHLQHCLAGLDDELRPGRPRSVSDERVAALVRNTVRAGPRDGTLCIQHITD